MILQRRRIAYQVWMLPLVLLACLQYSLALGCFGILVACIYACYPWIAIQTYLWVPQYLRHFPHQPLPEPARLPTIPPHHASLSLALLEAFRWDLLTASSMRLLVHLAELAKPLLTARLLEQLSSGQNCVWSSIIWYSCVSILGAVIEQRQIDVRDRMVLQIRMALTALVHDKSYIQMDDLHEKAQQSTHLLAYHIGQLSGTCWLPLRVLGGLLVFYQQVGMASMSIGILLVLLYVPVRRCLLAKRTQWQNSLMDTVNRRIRLLEHMVEQLASLRMMGGAWIALVRDKISGVRDNAEWEQSKMASSMDHLLSFVRMACRSGGPLLSLVLCRWWFDDALPANRVYVVQTVLRELFPLLLDVPHAFDGWWAAQRPYQQLNRLYQQTPLPPADSRRGLPFELLFDGELVAVVGKVGAGKSRLLNQIALGSPHKVGYVGQPPWILNGSLQENITMGQTFDPKWYQECLRISGLQHDLVCGQLAHHSHIAADTLSGGQQMRVALARALYSQSSLLVLDNILASVDQPVSQSIVNLLLRPKHKQYTVVIVTQDTEVLALADRVCLVENKRHELKTLNEWMQQDGFCRRAGLLDCTHGASMPLTPPPSSSGRNTAESAKKELQPPPATTAATDTDSHWMAPIRYLIRLCGWHLILLHMAAVVLQCLVSKQSHQSLHRLEHLEWTLFWWTSDILLDYACSWLTDIGWRHPIFYKSHRDILDSLCHHAACSAEQCAAGHVLSLLTDEQTNLDKHLPARLSQTAMFVLKFGYEFYLILAFHPLASAVLLLVFAMMYWVVTLTSRPLKKILQRQSELGLQVAAHMQETRHSHLTVRGMHAETFMRNRLIETINSIMTYQRMGDSVETWIDLMMSLLREISVIMAFVLAALRGSSVDVTQMSLVYLSVTYQLARIQHLIRHSHSLQSSLTKAQRYIDFINNNNNSPEMEEEEEVLPADGGDIVFEDVSARYSRNAPRVLRNISFTIRRGQHVGVVGRTGAGKTSLVMALLGLLPLDHGAIRIGSAANRRPHVHVHVVPQRPVLIPGTLRQNLTTAKKPLPDRQLTRALRQVLLPASLCLESTMVASEWSPGQLQLLCLARALLSDSPIVVLDEPTAEVDTATAQHLYQIIQQHFTNRTVIVIAHRMLDMMGSLDSVLMIDNGILC